MSASVSSTWTSRPQSGTGRRKSPRNSSARLSPPTASDWSFGVTWMSEGLLDVGMWDIHNSVHVFLCVFVCVCMYVCACA